MHLQVTNILDFVDRACLYNLVNKTNLVHSFLIMFIAFLYTFRATKCPSSGEITVSMWHLVFVIIWMTLWYAWRNFIPSCIPDSHPYSDTYQVSNRYGSFSWWWAYSCTKHVEKTINILRKFCTTLVLFTRLPLLSTLAPAVLNIFFSMFAASVGYQVKKRCIIHK